MKERHIRFRNQTAREATWTIHILATIKLLKGILLFLVAIKLLTLINSDVDQWLAEFISRHRIDPENRFVHGIIEKLSGVENKQLVMFSVGSFLYSGLQITEGIGLWLQKRWAEYMTVIVTSLLIPLEIYEIFEKFTWVRVVIFFVNIFIVWYLITRLRDERQLGK